MANTGSIRIEQRDVNPNSPTYNQVRYIDGGVDYARCPLPVTYQSAAISSTVYKNDCQPGYEAQGVTYTLPAGHSTSQISQADANAKAQAYYDANKQAYANANDVCRVPVTLADTRLGAGYYDIASVCNYSGMFSNVYTSSGTLTNGEPVYWDAAGTELLPDGFYKREDMYIVRIYGGVITQAATSCSGELEQ